MTTRTLLREDSGAVTVLYGLMFALAIIPLLVVMTTAEVRSTTTGELQRAGDSGALAGAATFPFANLQAAINYVNATSGGTPTTTTLNALGFNYPYTDPTAVACTEAQQSASDPHNLASHSWSPTKPVASPVPPDCLPAYVAPDFLTDAVSCASGMSTYTPTATTDLSSLLPALLRPGLQVTLSWKVTGPMDALLGGSSKLETTTSIARRRFKNMVVLPMGTLSLLGTSIDLTSVVSQSTAGTLMDATITSTESLLTAVPSLSGCASLLENERNDLKDAVTGGPSPTQTLSAAASAQTPIVAVVVVQNPVPFLDFVPVCVQYASTTNSYIGWPTSYGSCTVMTPGAFRSSLRRQ